MVAIIFAVVVSGFVLFTLICSFILFNDKKSKTVHIAFGKLEENSEASVSEISSNLKVTNI